MVDVTQADREAAADYVAANFSDQGGMAARVRSGAEPHTFPMLVQAFAAHRLAAEARAEKLVEALEGWADWHRKACIDSDDDLTYINGDGWADADKLAEQSRAALSEYAGEGRS